MARSSTPAWEITASRHDPAGRERSGCSLWQLVPLGSPQGQVTARGMPYPHSRPGFKPGAFECGVQSVNSCGNVKECFGPPTVASIGAPVLKVPHDVALFAQVVG